MLTRAAQEHNLDLARSWMIGDKDLDLGAGRNAGCRVALVRTGYGAQVDGALADLVALDLAGLPGASLYIGSWSEWCRNPKPRLPAN